MIGEIDDVVNPNHCASPRRRRRHTTTTYDDDDDGVDDEQRTERERYSARVRARVIRVIGARTEGKSERRRRARVDSARGGGWRFIRFDRFDSRRSLARGGADRRVR
jgi:hypothetical protein